MTRLLLLVALSVTALGQSAAPPPQAQQPATPPLTTLHANSRIVLVDVVATDAKGQPVRTLKKSDFTILENNQPQTIVSFEPHIAPTSDQLAKIPARPKLEPGVFTNYSPMPAGAPMNILLLDTLNTPLKDQAYVRSQMLDYLKNAHPSAPMAIFGLTSRLTLLQSATSDPELLRSAVTKKGMRNSSLMDNPLEGDTPGQDTSSSWITESQSATTAANLAQFEAQEQSFQLQLRVQYTLQALSGLARYLTTIPGRKNLIWFSGSFPISIAPDGDLQDPFAVAASYEDEFRDTTVMLTASQVAVYPVDARGLQGLPMFSAANSGRAYARNPGKLGSDIQKFNTQNAGEQATMLQMADETGGKAFLNSNGLRQAVEQITNIGANYYTLSYVPTNTKDTGDFRKIKVQLAQSGINLAYRHGYFTQDSRTKLNSPRPQSPQAPAELPKPISAPNTEQHPIVLPSSDPMRVAMQRGAPEPSQILMKVRVQPFEGTTAEVVPGNKPDAGLKGPYHHYSISYAAVPGDFKFSITPDGIRHGAVEFVALVCDANGQLWNAATNTIRANIPPEAYAQFQRTGVQYRQDISVPAKGEYFLRIGIHDMTTDHVGAVEVPVAVLTHLPKVPATPPPAESAPATPNHP